MEGWPERNDHDLVMDHRGEQLPNELQFHMFPCLSRS